MKRVLFTIFFLSAYYIAISQIKPQVKEILFGLSIPSSKYDTRKLLHASDNFSNIEEHSWEDHDIINVDFKDNYKLGYLKTSSERTASFWFNKDTDINFAFGFTLKYLPQYVEECTKQYNEIINIFKPVSYKASNRPWIVNGVQRGDELLVFSSPKQYQKGKACIIMHMDLVKPCETCTDRNTYYWISFSFYKQGLD